MSDLEKIRTIYKLKRVYRWNSVEKRKESSAEHSWSALMLADYFLTKYYSHLDRLKVYELLMYHDLIETEVGDVGAHEVEARKLKHEKEMGAIPVLKAKLPFQIGEKFEKLFPEFENQTSAEAKFARAIDRLDAQIHGLDNKKDWVDWSEEMSRGLFEKCYADFPELLAFFEEFLAKANQNGFFSQKI